MVNLIAVYMTGFYSKDFILESAYGQFYFSSIVVYFIASIGAIFTTLYSVKVLYLTFLANPLGPINNYKNAHEGDIFMSLPAWWLRILSQAGVKLSNSGNALKLLIPNYLRKTICGWINSSCKVISQKISEKIMGYRGSKSDLISYLDLILILTIITLSKSQDQIYFITALTPIVVYINADQDKLKILKENAGKSGVYRWVNKDTGKCYIGSSVNLPRRFSCYYSIKFLMKKRSFIKNALLKYGYAKFSLEILEYCEPTKCSEKEQYYMDLVKSEYNILKTAGSLLGYKHFEETIKKISDNMKENKNGANGLGRQRAERAGSPSVQITVLDQETGNKTIYPSISEAAKALGVPSGSIRMYFSRNTQTPYKKRYLLQKL